MTDTTRPHPHQEGAPLMNNPNETLAAGYDSPTDTTTEELGRLRQVASAWNEAMSNQLDALEAAAKEGPLTPALRMQLGYARSARDANNALNGK